MKSRGWAAIVCVCAAAGLPQGTARAQATEPAAAEPAVAEPAAAATPAAPATPLGEQLEALAQARMISLEAASAEQLRALVEKGEKLVLDGRSDEAVLVLLEALESPRFGDFRELPEYAAAEHMAATALIKVGSQQSARRYLEHAVDRGPISPYYGPSVRKLVDVALALGDLDDAAAWLGKREAGMTDDARNELTYLRARAALARAGAAKTPEGRAEQARAAALLERIGKHSRFYGNAQYLLGVIATREKRWKSAEQRFCAVAGTGVKNRYSFFVDERFFEVQDLARLGLGRTAHEMRRGDDAFYYYFQVPRDSPRLSEALFEAAYATYEGDDHDTAVDLLDQLEAHAPSSAFVDEAAVLRGYVSLARCDFQAADQNFARFIDRFTPLVGYIDRLIANEARREQLYEALLAAKNRRDEESRMQQLILALLRVDPEFYRLHAQVRALDAEAARGGRSDVAMDALLARFEGSDKPRAVADEEAGDAALQAIDRDLQLARVGTRALGDDLDTLRDAAPGKRKEIAERERELSKIAERLHAVERRAHALRARQSGRAGTAASSGKAVSALLATDVQSAAALPRRVADVRIKLVRAASLRAEYALRELHDKLFGLLRRARIGRIDAVMGSKRRIELQIESLAAGRFPAELRDPLRVQGLLDDDEEYWPFEGEDWPDEYEERYGPGDGTEPARKGAAQ